MQLPRSLRVSAPLATALLMLASGASAAVPAPLQAQQREWEKSVDGGPGPSVPDAFYPGFDPASDAMPEPRRGGRVIVHLSGMPKNTNYMVENSAVSRRMLREVHETLVERDWETWEYIPNVAKGWVTEDTLVLSGGRGEDNSNIHYGRVTEVDEGYRVEPLSASNPLKEPVVVPKGEVERLEPQTVFTFELREGVQWQDGHVFDAGDVAFTFECYRNPHVDCEALRYKFEKIAALEVVDDLTVRFFYERPYYLALNGFIDFTLVPSHVFNLRDPDHADHDEGVTDERLGTYVNEHEANRLWVGLGPYRIVEWNNQFIEAKRFDDYFDPSRGGYVDTIRWRAIPGDDAAKQAVINGEIDFWDRLRTEDYFGEFVKQEAFTDHYYKALLSFCYMGYTVWNLRRPKFQDPRVRQALAHSMDMDEYIDTVYFGLASRTTSTVYHFSPDYNRDVEPVPFDLAKAEELLAEAEWYDRDGDGIIDKDGVPFIIEYLSPTGNKASEIYGQALQENLAKLGIKLEIATREWASFMERLDSRDFDSANLAWITPVESDPEQIWHSKWADVERSSNRGGFKDAEVDRLIEALQVELDAGRRRELLRELQHRIHELQPYLFMVNIPRKVTVSKRVRNFRPYAIDPGYRIREWYIVEGDDAAETAER